jgi:hypothetical protein
VTAGDALRSAIAREVSEWETFRAGDGHLAIGKREDRSPEQIADAVLALPELRALIAERDELRGVVEQQKALIARNHRAYLSIQGIDTSHLDGTGIAASRPRIDAQGVTGASGSTRDGETVGDE